MSASSRVRVLIVEVPNNPKSVGLTARQSLPPFLVVAAILLFSVLFKLGLIIHLDGRVYPDVVRSINFGLGVESGVISINTHVDNTKSFLGPMLSASLYHAGGIGAIKLYNMAVYICLFLTMHLIGRGRFDESVVYIALLLFAFYPGGHRNVSAGEIEDNTASILFAIAILFYIREHRVWIPSLLVGLAFLFKFWIAIFAGAVCFFLVTERKWGQLLVAGAVASLPILAISSVDDFATFSGLLMTVERQRGFTDWPLVGFRLLSTGLLVTVIVSAWTFRQKRDENTRLFFFMVAFYLGYIIIFRDAWAVTFVMMLCLVFAGFLIAYFLTRSRLIGSAKTNGRTRLVLVLIAYVLAGSAIAYHNLYKDTVPFVANPGHDATRVV